MEKHTVKWGSEEWDRPLSLTEKKKVLEKIDRKARSSNIFYLNTTSSAVGFLRKTLVNAHIAKVVELGRGKVCLLISRYDRCWI